MPLQLIFTSSPQGLTAGRSGYCTVARHRSLPDRLVQQLESIGTPHENTQGETFTFRELEAGGKNWCVLSRFVARGLDYTQRDNRLAHHVIFSLEEAAVLPPPAAIAGRWKGWRDEWSGAPVWLEGEDKPLPLENQTPLIPATTWRECAGTGAKAAWLIGPTGPAAVSLLNTPDLPRVLRLLAESSALLGKAAWAATFTTDAGVSGGEGFLWCVGSASGRPAIDLASAASLPAPTGDFARQAAVGVAAPRSNPAPTSRNRAAASGADNRDTTPFGIYLMGGLLLAAAVGAIFYFIANKSKDESRTPPAPVVAKPTPPPAVSTQTDDILRSNRALTEIQSLLEAEDYLAAAKLWQQAASLSPNFSRNYHEQIMPRLLRGFSAAIVKQLSSRLDKNGILNDPKACREITDEAGEALRIGNELKVPQDAAWKRLPELIERARLIRTIDVRPVLLITGEWLTSEAGPKSPSQADFKLTRNASELIAKLIEASGATNRESVSIRLRLLTLNSFHQRDEQTRFLNGEIRRGTTNSWIEASAQPGKTPAIAIGVGTRSNTVTLNFDDGEGARQGANRIIEVVLPNGDRQCIALIGDLKSLRPLNLGPDGLRVDTDTGVVRPAAWAESAVNAFVWVNGSMGLYPDGHEFPDRDLPSIRATRSLLETDIIRLENKQGPGTPPYDVIAGRRKLFREGDLLRAGAPWSIQAVDSQGTAGPRLIEFR
jgi:hypothetical protein